MYETIFVIGAMPTYWWAPVAALGGMIVGFLLVRTQTRRAARAIGWFIAILSLIWAIAGSVFVLSEWWVLRGVYQRGDYRLIEGAIEGFHAMPSSGKGRETFRVDAVDFSLSDFDMTSGFHTTTYGRGPLREGLKVRIAYYSHRGRNVILRLEIRRDRLGQ